jgi:hypothetical protein
MISPTYSTVTIAMSPQTEETGVEVETEAPQAPYRQVEEVDAVLQVLPAQPAQPAPTGLTAQQALQVQPVLKTETATITVSARATLTTQIANLLTKSVSTPRKHGLRLTSSLRSSRKDKES